MNRFLEKKDHIIDKLVNLTSDQKEEVKLFFQKHPSYESKIDWNDKSLSYKDFEPLLALDGKSKTQAKKYGLAGLVENKDYFDFGEAILSKLGHCHIYQPLSYFGSKVLASNRVPPIKGNGAKWCISEQKTDESWKDYTQRGIKFLFVFTKGTKYALTIYPESLHYENEVYTFEDKNIGWPDWCRSPEIAECIANLREISRPSLGELLSKYQDILVKNPDGMIDMIGKIENREISLFDFVKDGHFICRFNKWGDDFDCSGNNLTSLEGAPREVEGSFYCRVNKLTSLKGAPIKVGGDFDCSNNNLTSLEGAPREVAGNFDCSYNKKLTSLEGAPRKVGGNFNCCRSNLTSLEGASEKVGGDFICNENNLISLAGAPREVGNYFDCDHNNLTSLEGAPEKVGGHFNCSYNKLISLKGAPIKVGGNFNCWFNKLTSLKGAPKDVGGDFDYDDYLKK